MAICAPIGNHPIHINTLYDFMYMMLLRYIGFQFEHINKYIQKLAEQKKVGYAWANSTLSLTHRHVAGTKILSKQNIWILMHIHLELCSISRELNMIFGLQMMMQKFQNCLKRFDIIDNTLLKLGTITDYEKLRRKVMWYALGWIVIVILTTYCASLILKEEHDGVIASTIYTGLKFDQINEHIRNLMKNQKLKITQAWKNNRIYPHQDRFSKPLSSKCIMWITM
ncbi:PREDICTED: uncharacterized protein LOC105143666 [Acromyrmex echinatior]|uniref:uncharacterized protein LOC105143666 n=1 Tax=Acromyrmex echinatior TaxID=103372 RepID=UPI000580B989|nr:PREDICTED: uncharacterized protein LOC105143666 [Acromyrmex echinatior]